MPQLGYVILYVPSVDRTAHFYELAFGLAIRFTHESGYIEMETGATALAFASETLAEANAGSFRRQAPDAKPAAAEIALIVADVEAAFARALGAGAVAVKPPVQKPWGQIVAYVRDADGFLVELCTRVAT